MPQHRTHERGPPCNRTLGLDVSYAGIANQLIGLQNILCIASYASICAVNMVSVGYAPNNVHGLQSKSHQLERTINVTDILRFSPWAQAALRRGTFMARRTAPEISSRQKCVEANVSRCFVCHAYMSSPRSCVRDVADSARSIFFDQAYNARTDSSCKGPSLQDIVGVTPEIELAAEALKRNLGLTEPYAAIQCVQPTSGRVRVKMLVWRARARRALVCEPSHPCSLAWFCSG